MFTPTAVIHPSSDNDSEILVAGTVDGKARNVTITDAALASEITEARAKHDAAVKAVADVYADEFAKLETRAFTHAAKKFSDLAKATKDAEEE